MVVKTLKSQNRFMKCNFVADLKIIVKGEIETSSLDDAQLAELEQQIDDLLRTVQATIRHESALAACPTLDIQSLHMSGAIPEDISIFDD